MNKFNSKTGEEVVFYSSYVGRSRTGLNLSNKFEDVYEEIPPYAVDVVTGELLNKTPDPILKCIGKKNIFEEIQSFRDDCDIYKILERVAISGDTSFLNRRVGLFGDFVNLPDNINDFNQYVKKVFDENQNVSKEVLEAAINSSLSSSELEALIAKHVNAAIASQKNNDVPGGNE